MVNKNNTSSYMDEYKKNVIKNSEYTYRDALEVSAFLIETGKFKRFFKKNLKKWINCCIVVNTTSIFIFFKFLNLIFDDIYLSDNIII